MLLDSEAKSCNAAKHNHWGWRGVLHADLWLVMVLWEWLVCKRSQALWESDVKQRGLDRGL